MTLSAVLVSIFKSDPDVTYRRNVFFVPIGIGLLLFSVVFKFFLNECFNLQYFQSSLRLCRFIQGSLHSDCSWSLTIIWLSSKCGPDISIVYRYWRWNAKFFVTNSIHCKFFWYFTWGRLQTYRRI
jgi:hypothetical protein